MTNPLNIASDICFSQYLWLSLPVTSFGLRCSAQWHWYFTHFKLFYFPYVIGLVHRMVGFVMRSEPKAEYRTVQYEYMYRYTSTQFCSVLSPQLHLFTAVSFSHLDFRGNSKYHYYGIRVKPDSPLNRLQEDMQYMALRQQPVQQKQRYDRLCQTTRKRPVLTSIPCGSSIPNRRARR